MKYFVTDNSYKLINDKRKVTDFMIEQELRRLLSGEFSLDNFVWIKVKIDEYENRYIFDSENDFDKKGELKEVRLFEVNFDCNEWIKVTKEA